MDYEPTFACWVHDEALSKRNWIISKVMLQYWKMTNKFGREEKCKIDQHNGNDFWVKVYKNMNSLECYHSASLEVLRRSCTKLPEYQQIRCHMMLACGCWKFLLPMLWLCEKCIFIRHMWVLGEIDFTIEFSVVKLIGLPSFIVGFSLKDEKWCNLCHVGSAHDWRQCACDRMTNRSGKVRKLCIFSILMRLHASVRVLNAMKLAKCSFYIV